MVERDHGIATLPVTIDGRSIYGDDIQLAVVVAVDKANSAAGGFNDVKFIRRSDVGNCETGLLADVLKSGN